MSVVVRAIFGVLLVCSAIIATVYTLWPSNEQPPPAPRVKLAAQPRVLVAGIRTESMDYHAAEQAASNWCWAAALQMMLSRRGITITQGEMVEAVYGKLVDNPAGPQAIATILEAACLTGASESSKARIDGGIGRPSDALTVERLQHDEPLLLALVPDGAAVGHAVVLTAVVYEERSSGPTVRSWLVRDPSPEYRKTAGKRKLTDREIEHIRWFVYATR